LGQRRNANQRQRAFVPESTGNRDVTPRSSAIGAACSMKGRRFDKERMHPAVVILHQPPTSVFVIFCLRAMTAHPIGRCEPCVGTVRKTRRDDRQTGSPLFGFFAAQAHDAVHDASSCFVLFCFICSLILVSSFLAWTRAAKGR
jgi:hypothetical protein